MVGLEPTSPAGQAGILPLEDIDPHMEPQDIQCKKVSVTDGGVCIYCGSDGGADGLDDEHIIPYSLGGNTELEQASCKMCGSITSYLDGYLANATLPFCITSPSRPEARWGSISKSSCSGSTASGTSRSVRSPPGPRRRVRAGDQLASSSSRTRCQRLRLQIFSLSVRGVRSIPLP
jgi:hypothetical protein